MDSGTGTIIGVVIGGFIGAVTTLINNNNTRGMADDARLAARNDRLWEQQQLTYKAFLEFLMYRRMRRTAEVNRGLVDSVTQTAIDKQIAEHTRSTSDVELMALLNMYGDPRIEPVALEASAGHTGYLDAVREFINTDSGPAKAAARKRVDEAYAAAEAVDDKLSDLIRDTIQNYAKPQSRKKWVGVLEPPE